MPLRCALVKIDGTIGIASSGFTGDSQPPLYIEPRQLQVNFAKPTIPSGLCPRCSHKRFQYGAHKNISPPPTVLSRRAVERLGELLKSGELKDIVAIPTSIRTKEQAESLGIPLVTLDTHSGEYLLCLRMYVYTCRIYSASDFF